MYEKRPQYYQAIEQARKANDSGAFIGFALSAVLDTITDQEKHQAKHQDKHQVELSGTQTEVLMAHYGKTLSRREIFAAIGLNGDSRSFARHIAPLIECGLIELTMPDKSNSRLQKYRLTDGGRAYLADKAT